MKTENQKPKKKPKTGGRQKGTPNKLTADLRTMIMMAFEKAGGVDYLVGLAKENPSAFLTLVGKVVPRELNANVGGSLSINMVNEFDD